MARPTNAELERWKALEAEGLAECRECGEVKSLDCFGFYKGKRRRKCKPCTNAEVKRYRDATDPEKLREMYQRRNLRWRERDPERYRWHLRNSNLKRLYGITADDFDRMLAEQGGGCAICGSPDPQGRNFHVDHCHDSKVVRGILCHPCNTGLGNFVDDPGRLAAAVAYLRRC